MPEWRSNNIGFGFSRGSFAKQSGDSSFIESSCSPLRPPPRTKCPLVSIRGGGTFQSRRLQGRRVETASPTKSLWTWKDEGTLRSPRTADASLPRVCPRPESRPRGTPVTPRGLRRRQRPRSATPTCRSQSPKFTRRSLGEGGPKARPGLSFKVRSHLTTVGGPWLARLDTCRAVESRAAAALLPKLRSDRGPGQYQGPRPARFSDPATHRPSSSSDQPAVLPACYPVKDGFEPCRNSG